MPFVQECARLGTDSPNFSHAMRKAKAIVKACWAILLPLIGFVYTGAVLENLWNWFIAPAVHGSDIGLGQALGIILAGIMLVTVCTREIEKERRWAGTRIVIAACVPEGKLSSVVAALKAQEEKPWINTETWERVIAATTIGAMGWVIHTFFM
jgi:hypothetical protein